VIKQAFGLLSRARK